MLSALSVIKPVQPSSPVQQAIAAPLRTLYFGDAEAVTPSSAPRTQVRTPAEQLIAQAVDWYDGHVRTIPSLDRKDRTNHRLHLRMIGDVLGLLPPLRNSRQAYRQYVQTFNALETKVAPGKKDFRMYCHDRIPLPRDNDYILRNYGFYILVFAPNGAIESFRHNTPPAVDMNGRTETDGNLRRTYFDLAGEDFDRLQTLLNEKGQSLSGVPDFLADPENYTRSVFKPGTDGQDAWQNDYVVPNETRQRKATFKESLRDSAKGFAAR